MPKSAAQIQAEFDEFRQRVLNLARETKLSEGWCDSGFQDGMRALGLDDSLPREFAVPVRVTVHRLEHEKVEDRSDRSFNPNIRTTKYLAYDKTEDRVVDVMATSEEDALTRLTEKYVRANQGLVNEPGVVTFDVEVPIAFDSSQSSRVLVAISPCERGPICDMCYSNSPGRWVFASEKVQA